MVALQVRSLDGTGLASAH